MFFGLEEALRRYDDGVHDEGAAASAAAVHAAESRLGKLPDALGKLYRRWNGLRLFLDSFVIWPLAEVQVTEVRGQPALLVGEALGGPLWVDPSGRILVAGDDGESVCAGSDLEAFLQATLVREAYLVDKQGEWRDVFDGDELTEEVRRKRARAGRKADPGAASWLLETAELAFDDGDEGAAQVALETAVKCDPLAGGAWALLAGLLLRGGHAAEAERAFATAAAATVDAELRARRWAEAARAAAVAGHDPAGHRAAVVTASAASPAAWRAEAEARNTDGDVDGALQLAELAAAAGDEEARALVRLLRARRSLRVV